jgi:hypothetical protein
VKRHTVRREAHLEKGAQVKRRGTQAKRSRHTNLSKKAVKKEGR